LRSGSLSPVIAFCAGVLYTEWQFPPATFARYEGFGLAFVAIKP